MRSLVFCVVMLAACSSAAWADSSTGGIPGMLANGAYSVTGQYTQKPCPLTQASTITIAVNACAASASDGTVFYSVTLASGAQTLAFPTGLAAGGGQTIDLQITQPASGAAGTLTTNAGYIFPGASLTSGNISLSTANGAIDEMVCHSMPSSASNAQGGLVMNCPGGVSNNLITTNIPVPSFVAANPSDFSASNNTGSSGATSLTPSGTLALTAGDYLIAVDTGSGNAGYSAAKPNFTGVTVSAGTIGTCVAGTGTRLSTQASGYDSGTELWYCPITVGGAASVTGHWASTCFNCGFVSMDVHNLNPTTPDAGIGATTSSSSAGTTASVSTGSSSPGKQYFYVVSFPISSSTPGTPTSWTQVVSSGTLSWGVFYQIAASSSSPVTASSTIASANWGASIWAGSP